MGKGGLRSFLKNQSRSAGTMNQCVLLMSNFGDNLAKHRHSKGMDSDLPNLKRGRPEGDYRGFGRG